MPSMRSTTVAGVRAVATVNITPCWLIRELRILRVLSDTMASLPSSVPSRSLTYRVLVIIGV